MTVKSLIFTVPGIPRPKERPRLNRKTGNVYTPSRSHAYEYAMALHALAAMRSQGWSYRTIGRMGVWIHAYMPDKRTRDLDNVAKALDGINAVVWKDDSQVDELHVYRRIDREKPRLEVRVERLSDKEDDNERRTGTAPNTLGVAHSRERE